MVALSESDLLRRHENKQRVFYLSTDVSNNSDSGPFHYFDHDVRKQVKMNGM